MTTKTFNALRYELPMLPVEFTREARTKVDSLCDTYPESVVTKWKRRCAGDVEHLADGHPEAMKCIALAKKYRDGLATKEEVNEAAATALFYAAIYATYASASAYAAYASANPAGASAYAAGSCSTTTMQFQAWNKYLQWLIDDLLEYEEE